MFDADQHFYEPRDSFTRYIDPEYQQRIFTPAVLSMHDLERAVELLDWAIDRGARAIILTAGPAGGRSPAHPDFDPFWARVDEAGLVVAFHITDAGYTERRSPEWGLDPRPTSRIPRGSRTPRSSSSTSTASTPRRNAGSCATTGWP